MIDPVNQRIGIGTDVHRLAPGRSMRVAGLDWPEEEVGPEGHTDGDVVLHAVCDALLSAASLGDLGSNFGTSDPQWAGASGTATRSKVEKVTDHDAVGSRKWVIVETHMAASTGIPAFTWFYAPPEQIARKPRNTTPTRSSFAKSL